MEFFPRIFVLNKQINYESNRGMIGWGEVNLVLVLNKAVVAFTFSVLINLSLVAEKVLLNYFARNLSLT